MRETLKYRFIPRRSAAPGNEKAWRRLLRKNLTLQEKSLFKSDKADLFLKQSLVCENSHHGLRLSKDHVWGVQPHARWYELYKWGSFTRPGSAV